MHNIIHIDNKIIADKRVLAVFDIHTYWTKAKAITDKYEKEVDLIIYGGDYFDQFNDLVIDNIDTAKWVKDNIHDKNKIFLHGNHNYKWKQLACAGFTEDKFYGINAILTDKEWKLMKLAVNIDDVLYSHAGIDYSFIENVKGGDVNNINDYVKLADECLKQMWKNKFSHPLLQAGQARGGRVGRGGIIWQDFNWECREPKINQIIGHTPLKNPPQSRINIQTKKQIICIDSYPPLKYSCIIQNGDLTNLIPALL